MDLSQCCILLVFVFISYRTWTKSIGLSAVGSTLKVVMGTHDMWQYFPLDGLTWTNYSVLLSYPFL